MAAFADALDLKTAVGDHVGNRSISDVWPRLVQMAETTLNQKLRTVWQETPLSLTFADGESDLPADFLEMIDAYGLCGYQMRASMRADSRLKGTSYTRYSIGSGKIYIRGFTGNRDILYYAALPTLSASLSASNWLLERNGNVYLYAVGLEAAKFLKDVDLAQATKALLDGEMMSLKIDDDRMRWGGAVVRVQGMTP
jgi:hypothetical protein